MQIRLDKLLAHSGYGSRKDVKSLIRKGYVKINDLIVKNDDLKVDTEIDEITIDDENIKYDEFVYLLINKPKGYLSATFDSQYPTILDLIPIKYGNGLFPVGRLDIDTTGLQLITNDGSLAHQMLSPKHHVYKKYDVIYEGVLCSNVKELFKEGININDEYITKPAKIELLEAGHCIVDICEGKFHQVKRMIKHCGAEVKELKRISFGKLILPNDLEEGSFIEIKKEDIV